MFVVNVLEMHASSDPEDWMAELVMMRLLIQSLTAWIKVTDYKYRNHWFLEQFIEKKAQIHWQVFLSFAIWSSGSLAEWFILYEDWEQFRQNGRCSHEPGLAILREHGAK